MVQNDTFWVFPRPVKPYGCARSLSGRCRSLGDRGGGKISEAIRSVALRAVGDLAGLVQHQDRRNRFDVKRPVDAVGEDQHAPGLLLLKKWGHKGFVFVSVYRQENNIIPPREFRSNVRQR